MFGSPQAQDQWTGAPWKSLGGPSGLGLFPEATRLLQAVASRMREIVSGSCVSGTARRLLSLCVFPLRYGYVSLIRFVPAPKVYF